MQKTIKDTRIYILLFCITLLFSLAFYLLVPAHLKDFGQSDYFPQMKNLLDGKGFFNNGILLDRYPPLVPIIFAGLFKVAILFHQPFYVLYVVYTILCLAITNVFLFKMAELLINRRTGIIAAILFASCPFILFCIIRLVSEPGFLLLTYMALYFLIREYIAEKTSVNVMVIIACMLALAMLARPTGILYPVFFALFILLAFRATIEKRLLYIGTLAVFVLVMISPWEYLLYKEHQRFIPLSTGSYPTICDGFKMNNKLHRGKIYLPADVQVFTDSFCRDYNAYEHHQKTISGFLKDQFSHSPATVFKFYMIKAGRAWYGTDAQSADIELLNMFFMSCYLVLFMIGVWGYFKSPTQAYKSVGLLFIVLIFYSWGITTVSFSILRYMVPVLPIIFIFASIGTRLRKTSPQ